MRLGDEREKEIAFQKNGKMGDTEKMEMVQGKFKKFFVLGHEQEKGFWYNLRRSLTPGLLRYEGSMEKSERKGFLCDQKYSIGWQLKRIAILLCKRLL